MKTWMPGTSPGTTRRESVHDQGTRRQDCIVTGAGRNIGRAIALTLAEGGASVVINVRSNRSEAESVAREIEAAGGKALVHVGDIADPKAVQAMADVTAA